MFGLDTLIKCVYALIELNKISLFLSKWQEKSIFAAINKTIKISDKSVTAAAVKRWFCDIEPTFG